MKFKKILSSVLATVMAASVLSVGLVVSASAALPEGTVLTPVEKDYYELNSSELSTLGEDKLHKGMYVNVKAIEAEDVKIDDSSEIIFKVKEPCKLAVVLDVADAHGYKITSDDQTYKGDTTYTFANNVLLDVKDNVTYTITGGSSNTSTLDALDFVDSSTPDKTIKLLDKSGSTSAYGKGAKQDKECIAIATNGTDYYGIVVTNDDTINANEKIIVKHKQGQSTVETTQVFRTAQFIENGYEYTTHDFGQNAKYLFAFKINGISPGEDISTIRGKLDIEFVPVSGSPAA